jgi:hypothetical protein
MSAPSVNVTNINSPLIFATSLFYPSPRTFTKPSNPTTDWVEDDDSGSKTPDFRGAINSMVWSSS